MPDQNPSVAVLYKSLCDQQDALTKTLTQTTDPKMASALSIENAEIMHRMIIAQNMLFQQNSAALTQSVNAVTAASADLKTKLASLNKAADIFSAVSTYLTTVDSAIDLAKKMAV